MLLNKTYFSLQLYLHWIIYSLLENLYLVLPIISILAMAVNWLVHITVYTVLVSKYWKALFMAIIFTFAMQYSSYKDASVDKWHGVKDLHA